MPRRKRKSRIEKFLEKEVFRLPKEPKRFAPIQLAIPGKVWEKVSEVKHKRMAKLIRAYWKTVGFKTRIRKKGKDWEVDIKNTITPRKKLRSVT